MTGRGHCFRRGYAAAPGVKVGSYAMHPHGVLSGLETFNDRATHRQVNCMIEPGTTTAAIGLKVIQNDDQ